MPSTPETLLVDIFRDVINIIDETIGKCHRDDLFLARYLAGAVLSYIEEREQDLVLSMKYDEWVLIDESTKDKVIDKIEKYINKFSIACRDKPLDDEVREKIRNLIRQKHVIERTLCYLYKHGIYSDGVSKYVLIKNVPEATCEEKLCSNEFLDSNGNSKIEVRSRFIEIARNLYLVKRRFPDIPSFIAKPLVDRVFAYVEPRNLPLGRIPPREVFKEIEELVKDLYKTYKNVKLGSEASQRELEILSDILSRFFDRITNIWSEPLLFYKYQVRGLKRLIESMITAIKEGKTAINIIEAPTGAGKTEIFVLALLVLALARKLAWYYEGKINKENSTPATIIVYPRLALASNQIDRLLKYLYELNKVIQEHPLFDSIKPTITLSMNYTETRFKKEYEKAVRQNIDKVKRKGKIEQLAYKTEYGIKTYIGLYYEKNKIYIELKYFKCPNGAYPRIVYNLQENKLVTEKVYCRDTEIDYIRVTKDDIKQSPGDIHITLFETLRQNLWSKSWKKLFGVPGLDGPLMFVLDEIHTYVGICGARYAYVLRRVMSRVRHQTLGQTTNERHQARKHGFVIVGVSATIPNPDEFIENLLLERISNLEEAFIRVDEKETIPLGNEYFFIVVPTTKYMVDSLSVSIQTIMTLFYNLPPFPDKNNEYSKKALIFIDNLDVVARAKYSLADAVERNTVQGSCTVTPYGLQDLRNPFNSCFDATQHDYSDHNIPRILAQFGLERIHNYGSWKDGELWWPYAIEYAMLAPKRFTRVIEYTSRVKEKKIEEGDLIVTTSALEVGIDYRDVVLIYQHGVPPNISALIQRAGRAGRRIFKNPLTRTAVAVQLSPDIPLQASYFEIFTRSSSLREALKYDRLYVATRNEYVINQTLLEAIIDYLVYKSVQNTISFSTKIINIIDFECRMLPAKIEQILKPPYIEEFVEYLSQIFQRKITRENIEKILVQIKNECKQKRVS